MRPRAAPKYSLAEVERRWIVVPMFLPALEGAPYRLMGDLYVQRAQLRLRKATSSAGDVVYKLCKKYGRGTSPSNPITNLYPLGSGRPDSFHAERR